MKLLRRESISSFFSLKPQLAVPADVLECSRQAHQRLQAVFPNDIVNFGLLVNPLDPSSRAWHVVSNTFPVNATVLFPPAAGTQFTLWSVKNGYQSARVLRQEREPCRQDCDHLPCIHRTFILVIRQPTQTELPTLNTLLDRLANPPLLVPQTA